MNEQNDYGDDATQEFQPVNNGNEGTINEQETHESGQSHYVESSQEPVGKPESGVKKWWNGLDGSKQQIVKYGGAIGAAVLVLAVVFIPGSGDSDNNGVAQIEQPNPQSDQGANRNQESQGSALGDSFEPGRTITEEDRKKDNQIGRTGREELLEPAPDFSPPEERHAPIAENPVELDERAKQASYVLDEVVHNPIPDTDQFFNVQGRLRQHSNLEADGTIQNAYLAMYYADSSNVFASRAAKPEVRATEEAGVYEVVYPVAAALKPLPGEMQTKKGVREEMNARLDVAIQSNVTVPVTFILDFNRNEASMYPERWW